MSAASRHELWPPAGLRPGFLLRRVLRLVHEDVRAAGELDLASVETLGGMLVVGDHAKRSVRRLQPVADGVIGVLQAHGGDFKAGQGEKRCLGSTAVKLTSATCSSRPTGKYGSCICWRSIRSRSKPFFRSR